MSSSTHSAKRPVKAASPRRISPLMIAIVAGGAVAVVLIAIAFQSAGGGASSLPARTTNSEGRTLGDENATVTLIEYADFQCPVCKRAEMELIPQIEKDYVATGKVKFEFRMYPFIGQESFNAAQAAEAARDQGKFWEYHDALFNAQGAENDGNFSYDKLVAIAQKVGLDVPKFEATLTANTHLAAVQAEADGAHAAGVTSTPTFFVSGANGDQKIAGVQPYGTFRAAIDAALAAAK